MKHGETAGRQDRCEKWMDGQSRRRKKKGREYRSNDRVRDGRLDGAAAILALSFHDGWRVFFPSYLACHV